jgi:pSer/pThr/pTyr-binding forkhead associated (FHA) protein
VLESVTLENKHARMIHILHPKNEVLINRGQKKYLIGRGQDCDLKVSDISVSRNHCQIQYMKGKFLLQDMGSKFGTLVLCKDPVEVPLESTIGL